MFVADSLFAPGVGAEVLEREVCLDEVLGASEQVMVLQEEESYEYIQQACLHILSRQTGIVVQNLLLGPALSQKFNDELHREARALYNRFP
jgi:hypothetical protein